MSGGFSVLVVDDQSIVRQGISQLLELSEKVDGVWQASSGDEALGYIEQKPDVVLLDIFMPKKTGFEVLPEIKALDSSIPVIILTTFDDDQYLKKSFSLGAQGFLLKDVTLEMLMESIERVTSGHNVIQPCSQPFKEKVGSFSSPLDSMTTEKLSIREQNILRLVARGFNNKEIGELLTLSSGTVKNYVSSILEKMNVRDRTQAVVKGAALGAF